MNGYEHVMGTTPLVSFGITFVLAGGGAWMMGRALGLNWRPDWQLLVYAALLAVADRFLIYALYGGDILSVTGYLVDASLLAVIAALSYQIARARQMVRQYPWAFRRSGLFGWCEKAKE